MRVFLSSILMVVGLGLAVQAPADEIRFPAAAGVLNVKDFGAQGDGVTDDTAAIQAAMKEALKRSKAAEDAARNLREALFYERDFGAITRQRQQANQTVYLPRGTYLVSDKLSYGAVPELARKMQFVGESRQGTILRLKDNAVGYDNPKKARPLLTFFEGEKQKNWGDGSNIAMNNVCENLTIDVGSGNAGAIGLDFINNNAGYVQDVTIRSSDPQKRGAMGMKLTRQLGGIGLIKRVRVEGFDNGIVTGSWKIAYTFEHIELEGQREAGMRNTDKPLQIRGLRSKNSVPAVISSGEQAQIVLIDSELTGGAADAYAIENRGGSLLARNVSSAGYKSALREHGKEVPGARIEEYAYPKAHTLLDGTPAKTLGLEIKETPDVPREDPAAWAIVDGTRQVDDTAAIQAAIDSGKTTMFLPGDFYQVDGTIFVRGNVRRLTLGRSNFFRSRRGNAQPLFVIENGNHPVTVIEQVDASTGGGDFVPTFFLNRSDKTVVLRDMLYSGRGTTAYRNEGRGDVFIEAIGTGGGPFIFKNQRVWARFINPEYSAPQIINDGGQLWVLGFKFEGGSPGFVGLNGSKTEVLGGLFNLPGGADGAASALVINDNSTMSITGAEDFAGPTYVVREFHNGAERRLARSEVWTPRGKGKDVINMALYRGDAATTVAANPAEVSIRVTDRTGSEDGDPVAFEVTRQGDTAQPLTVNLALHPHTSIGAAELRDLPRSVVIPAGRQSATVIIHAADDDKPGSPRPLRLAIVGGAGYRVDPATSASGKAILQDNEVNLGSGALALYSFAKGDASDASGNNHHGKAQGVTVATGDGIPAAVFDDAKSAIVLAEDQGSLSYREFSGDVGRSFMHASFGSRAVSFWAQAKPGEGRRTLFSEGGDAGWNVRLVDGKITATGSNNREDHATLSAPWPTDGKWHHVAFVYSSGDLMLYVDGRQVAAGELEEGSVDSHKAGAQLGPAPGVKLTDFVVYQRALNATEVAALAAMPPGKLNIALQAKPANASADKPTAAAPATSHKVDFEKEKVGEVPKGAWGATKGKVAVAEADGNRYLRFTNAEADKSTQLHYRFNLQPQWKHLKISARIKTIDFTRGPKPANLASIFLTWENDKNKGFSYGWLGLDKDSDWTTVEKTLPVPEGARSIKLSVGLNKATGEMLADDIRVEPVPNATP